MENTPESDLDVEISPEMKVNMLEIRVLELLSEDRVEEAVEFVGVSHGSEKVFLSDEILDALLKKIDPVTQVCLESMWMRNIFSQQFGTHFRRD